ncbi:MAG: N-acetylmuramoyl-L-alanine amidase [SAR86 cluster bacterium SAR86B]|jgi:N-acetylmuramoyl-L-alanine amidase|uniref:N-acetylmuramoyl-L-alanine amidase n=1 Tax=SAR86 cluster bacterium SAR86B TaxID=1123867 RepID=J4X2N4_9GAMM|nr:MAG: N-acetylmuramoyl-L-alanine amidase [SAR86 cluster bacterium SAR86B]|tara:strand:+ start:5794 stop:7050 length:1257 start_codon:yes stop_codon:yes gene_type:complete
MVKKLIFLFIFASSLITANELSFNEVVQLENGGYKISFNLDKVAYIKSYSSNDPNKIILDVHDAVIVKNFNKKFNFPIKEISIANNEKIARLIVDLYEPVFWQKPKQEKIDNLIEVSFDIERKRNLKTSKRDVIVAIDAGHGGKYPGAVGPNNILEKDVTLLIAKELQRTLQDTDGYEAVMIRDGDNTISLNKRYQDARKYGADIFISIHADGFRLSSVKGASVFIWSEESSSTIARNLSDKKREKIQAEIKNIEPYDFNDDEARYKYPEIYKNKIKQSRNLGAKILDQLKRDPYTHIHKENVEYADFRVLKSVDIPSVLVESGFITNPEDAKRLKGKPGRRMIARSIFLGIHNYFKDFPIEGTFSEDYIGHVTYTIQKGDVLSEIAIRFGVTVNEILDLNNIDERSLYIGQKIKIAI